MTVRVLVAAVGIAFASLSFHDPLAAQTATRAIVIQGQPVIEVESMIGAQPAQAVAAGAIASNPEADAETQAAQQQQQRMQKIQRLQFDRRPSAILALWSEQNGEASKQADEEDEETQNEDEGKPEDNSEATESAGDADKDPEQQAKEDAAAEQQRAAERFDEALEKFRQNVTLGNWGEVKHYLVDLPEEEGTALYKRLVQVLRTTPTSTPEGVPPEVAAQLTQLRSMQRQGRLLEANVVNVDDVIALIDAAPIELDRAMLSTLGGLLRVAINQGSIIENVVTRLQAEVEKPPTMAILTRRQAARILVSAGHPSRIGDFLPDLDQAIEQDDFEALNLLSRYFLAQYSEEQDADNLEQAWRVTQAVLAATEVDDDEEKEEALRRAVELAPQVRDELGQTWLEASFTERPERGIEIIAAIGAAASQAMQNQPHSPSQRLKSLKLQTTAVEALLESAPDVAGSWRDRLDLLAGNWLREAVYSYQNDQSTSMGPRLRRDPFGNYFYYDEGSYGSQPRQPNRARPIKTGELLEIRPSDQWLDFTNASVRPKFDMIFAQLFLKVAEEDEAFPYIEQLANTHPTEAEDLVEEFLRVWTQNHDPNASRNRTNYYMFMYGYERKAESIPLTRSKQERNLKELAELVKRLRALPLGDLNEELLAKAFTTCHSSAEVYRLEAIQSVFGALEDLDPKTLAELVQQMRANLVGVWRQPSVQEQNKTKRKQKDIQAEVLRGYEVARRVVEDALETHPDNWNLILAKATIDHDENNYHQELAHDSKFSQQRQRAFGEFQRAAELYAAQVDELSVDEYTTKPFELWYYASLGACDLQHVREDAVPDGKQPAMIREAMLELPGEAAAKHEEMFANSLFTRMSAVNPAVKFRYLRNGFEIVGDHKQAREARQVFDYYNDLVTEIKLQTEIDGRDLVGHTRPFGLFVNLLHTREIERESGGFGRYLQNQNSGRSYYYNYGRPTEDYRDKFEEIVKEAFEEQFEILSVTFQSEDVNSRAIEEYGWRVTPYAYVLMKARGPQVDKIPPLRLDLDFLDTSGYAIIPIESPVVPIDARTESGDARPFEELVVTQTLDERQADEGKLILEVKATALGLVPELDEMLEVGSEGFDITETLDDGVSVAKFDPDSEVNQVVSERTWLITMNASEDLEELPTSFAFATPTVDVSETLFQRYDDADLLKVESVISLEEQYGETSYAWIWGLGIGAAVLLAVGIVMYRFGKPTVHHATERFQVPDNVTAFTVLGLLRQIQENNGFSEQGKSELSASISRLERQYFKDAGQDETDLHDIAESWIQRAASN